MIRCTHRSCSFLLKRSLQKKAVKDGREKHTFPIVCIGMSAGAIAPLIIMFRQLKSDTGMAFVALHHRRSFPTNLDKILAGCTSIARANG
jgi:chemotaxis response regulator CheB